jgi:hypothetical protein
MLRAMFGLVALLVVIGIIALVASQIEVPIAKQGVQAQDSARQISGRGDDGIPAIDSFKVTAKMRGTNLDGLEVVSVIPTGAMASVYGLQKGDIITHVDGTKVGDISTSDPELAKGMVVQRGFQGNLPITVLRNGTQINLPDKTGAAATATPGSTPPVNPSNANPPQNNSAQDQLKNLGIQTGK